MYKMKLPSLIWLTIVAFIFEGCSSSDTALKKQFNETLPVLEKIRVMQIEDSNVVRIAPQFTRLANDWKWPRKDVGISEKRWSEYKKLFKSANISGGIQKDGTSLFYFVYSSGIVGSSYSQGFVYMEQKPEHKNLRTPTNSCKSNLCYTHLRDNWYLFSW